MFYIFGDIHGFYKKLIDLFEKIQPFIKDEDELIFLGDYVDRGDQSYEVIDFLISLQKKYKVVTLMGNHERALLEHLAGEDKYDVFMNNGGVETIKSYKKHCNGVFEIPHHHMEFFKNLKYYYETKEFIAVHAGLDPKINNIEDQDTHDLLWIRDGFYRSKKRWDKTIIFGHTPNVIFDTQSQVYIDNEKNIIGVDSGVIYGKSLSCIRMPDRLIFNSIQ